MVPCGSALLRSTPQCIIQVLPKLISGEIRLRDAERAVENI